MEYEGEMSDKEKLAKIAFKHGLTLEAVRDIATFCRDKGIALPRDPRTIMRTSRDTVGISSFFCS